MMRSKPKIKTILHPQQRRLRFTSLTTTYIFSIIKKKQTILQIDSLIIKENIDTPLVF